MNLKLVDQSPGVIYTIFKIGHVSVAKSIVKDGDFQVMNLDADSSPKTWRSRHMQTTGIFREKTARTPDRMPGWISQDDDTIFPAGHLHRIAIGDVTIFCTFHLNPSDIDMYKLIGGDERLVRKGRYLMLASGQANKGGKELDAETIYLLSDDAVIQSTEGAMLIEVQPLS